MQEHFQPTTEGGCPLAHQEELQATGGAHHPVRHDGRGDVTNLSGAIREETESS